MLNGLTLRTHLSRSTLSVFCLNCEGLIPFLLFCFIVCKTECAGKVAVALYDPADCCYITQLTRERTFEGTITWVIWGLYWANKHFGGCFCHTSLLWTGPRWTTVREASCSVCSCPEVKSEGTSRRIAFHFNHIFKVSILLQSRTNTNENQRVVQS